MEHFLGGFGELDEDAIVVLKKAEELQHFLWFRSNFVDPRIN